VQPPVPPTGNPKPTGAALTAAFRFRNTAAANFTKALAEYNADRPLSFLSQPDSSETRPLVWSAFMASSLVLMGHVDSPEPVVAFYNPLYDAVLITRWAASQGSPKIVAADLRLASAISSGSSAAPPEFATWLKEMANSPAPDVLKGQYTRFLKAFEKAFPPRAKSIARLAVSVNAAKTATFVENQAVDALRNVLAVQQAESANYNPRLKELRTALAERDKTALEQLVPKTSATSAGVLLEMPMVLSKTLVPCYALLGQKDSMVFLQNTLLPRYYMLVVFRHGAAAADTQVRSILFFELPQEAR
jgi:hypothetical protein